VGRERSVVAWHGLDLADPWEEVSVAGYREHAMGAARRAGAAGKRLIVVGGSGLYVRAAIDEMAIPGQYPEVAAALDIAADSGGEVALTSLYERLWRLDPVAASRIDPRNRRRVLRALEVTIGTGRPFSSWGPGLSLYEAVPVLMAGLRYSPEVLSARIQERFALQVEHGFLEEVERLLDDPRGLSRTAAQALGYRELAMHLEGSCSFDEACASAIRRTRRFARRQWRWFRRDPRIRWIDPECEDPVSVIEGWLIGSGERCSPR